MSTRFWRSGAIFLTTILLFGGSAGAQPGKAPAGRLDRALVSAIKAGLPSHRVIVQTAPRRRAEVRELLGARGRQVRHEHPTIDGLSLEVTTDDLAVLLQHPAVLSVSTDATVAAAQSTTKLKSSDGQQGQDGDGQSSYSGSSDSTSSTSFSSFFQDFQASSAQWSLVRGSLGITWTRYQGEGVAVALIDSGIADSYDFQGRITAFVDFTKGGKSTAPYDDFGHGTHIAGLIGSGGWTYSGLAPKVRFVGLKVLDAAGQGRTSDVVAAIEFAVKQRKKYGIQIINLSLGHPIYEPSATDPLVRAVEAAARAGLVVVVSAGNHGQDAAGVPGYAGITSPGNAPSAITAGSLNLNGTVERSDDTVSPFSSRGPTWYDALAKPDVLAPGHGLVADAAAGSTLTTTNASQLTGSGTHIKLYGTSMAAGTVTAVVAMMIEANRLAFPGATAALPPNAIKAMLQYSALPLRDSQKKSAEYDLLTQGAGGINAAGALALAAAIDPGASTGSWWLRTAVQERTTIGTQTLEWGRRLIWGTRLLYGEAVYINEPAWASAIVWGDTLVWSDTMVWGDVLVWGYDIVWSDTLVWADAIVWGYDYLGTTDGTTVVWGDVSVGPDTVVWGNLSAVAGTVGTIYGNGFLWSDLSLPTGNPSGRERGSR